MFIMPAIIIMGLWHYTGVNALYFLAGFQNISPEVREAARMDGANSWQLFRFITLPLLRPTLIFVLTFAIIGSYNLFGEPTLLVGRRRWSAQFRPIHDHVSVPDRLSSAQTGLCRRYRLCTHVDHYPDFGNPA